MVGHTGLTVESDARIEAGFTVAFPWQVIDDKFTIEIIVVRHAGEIITSAFEKQQSGIVAIVDNTIAAQAHSNICSNAFKSVPNSSVSIRHARLNVRSGTGG